MLNDPLCPVARALRILLWSDTLGVPPWTLVVIFRIPETGATMYVKRGTVERLLKKNLVIAYLNPNHRLRHLKRCFMSHFLRISTWLALASAGVSRDAIVYRLRWNRNAVDFYI
jgi:hypothetical protein